VTRTELELLEMELDTRTHSCHGRHVTPVAYVTPIAYGVASVSRID